MSGLHFAEVDGIRVGYRRKGSGPPLVLLHGFIADGRAWLRQLDDLSRDFDVIAWDAPGCGQSGDPPEEYTMSQFADCLAGVLDHAAVGSAHILGLSWGGTLALEFYRRHRSRVSSLIIAGGYAGWAGSLGEAASALRLERCRKESRLPAEAWVPEWVPEGFSPGASAELLDELEAIMSDFHPVGFRAMSRALAPDFSDILPTIGVPTLLIWGDSDSRSTPSVGEDMHALIPRSRLVTLAGAGHISNLEQPAAFNRAVRQFLLPDSG